MTKIVLGTLFGSRLNLDGDQGNLLALRKYLNAAGFETEVKAVTNTEAALASHFLLLGHGSAAAMASLEVSLSALDWESILASVPGLAVGSGYEWMSSKSLVNEDLKPVNRVSEFQVATMGKLSALGYRNSESDLPGLALNGNFICSMLHGPILAKNPQLLDRAARATVTKAGGVWPATRSTELSDWIAHLNRISAQIWKLETEEEFQPLQ